MSKTGLAAPGWTMIPNALLDNLDDFSNDELRVTLVAMREMIGWHKQGPQPISISQFEKRGGVSRSGAQRGIKQAKDRGWLVEANGKGQRGTKQYKLHITDDTPRQPEPETPSSDPPPKQSDDATIVTMNTVDSTTMVNTNIVPCSPRTTHKERLSKKDSNKSSTVSNDGQKPTETTRALARWSRGKAVSHPLVQAYVDTYDAATKMPPPPLYRNGTIEHINILVDMEATCEEVRSVTRKVLSNGQSSLSFYQLAGHIERERQTPPPTSAPPSSSWQSEVAYTEMMMGTHNG